MAATLLQTQSGHNWASTYTLAITTTSGSTLIGTFSTTGANPSTVSDNGGNTWTRIASTVDGGATGQQRGALWYCLNANPVTQVYLTTTGNQNATAVVSEWTGITGVRGHTMQTYQTGVTAVPASPGDVVLGACFYYRSMGTAFLAVEAGWTSAGEVVRDTIYNSTAYRVAMISGNQGPLWDVSAANKATITAAFTTDSEEPTPNVFIRVGGAWKHANPYVRTDGSWKPADGEPL